MPHELESHLHGLKIHKYRIVSPKTSAYNCVAFAAGEAHRWWWPAYSAYWPEDAPRHETVESFVQTFRLLGYSTCDDGSLESDFEKVAIYADHDGVPTHMARQLPSGAWISKCGSLEDIEHEQVEALTGIELFGYGDVVTFLKRSRPNP